MRSTLIFKNIKDENKSTWEESARILRKFISTELDMKYTDKEINMFISMVNSQRSTKCHHKGKRSLFTNWQLAEEVHHIIIGLTSRYVLSVYAIQMYYPKSSQKDILKH